MKWKDKDIKLLSDDELREAILAVSDIDKNRLDKLDKPRKRHEKIFKNTAPTESPIFIQLAKELNDEFKKRELTEL